MDRATKMSEGTSINRTGMSTSSHAAEMDEVPGMTRASGSEAALKEAHVTYLKESHALGTTPPPATIKGAGKAAVQALKGHKAIAFVDKVCERMAFERTGVRLYQALLGKMEVAQAYDGGPDLDAVRKIHDEELEHAMMLKETLEKLGADPTALTPSADLVAMEGMGLGSVLGDPRTTVGQCLHALMVAELADKEGWTMLVKLAEDMGQSTLATQFRKAEQQEQKHLEQVRSWLLAYTNDEAQLG
jgi:rubrerythrin